MCEPIWIGYRITLAMLVNLFRRRPLYYESPAPTRAQAKTLLNIEGLGRQLYPELNLWEQLSPSLRTGSNVNTALSMSSNN